MSTHAISTNSILLYMLCFVCHAMRVCDVKVVEHFFFSIVSWFSSFIAFYCRSNPTILYYSYGHLRAKACSVKWTLNGYFMCNLMMCHWDFCWYSPSENLLQFFSFLFSFSLSIKCSLKSSLDIYRKLIYVCVVCYLLYYVTVWLVSIKLNIELILCVKNTWYTHLCYYRPFRNFPYHFGCLFKHS